MLLLIGTQRLTSHTQDLHEFKSDKKKILAQSKGREHKVPPLAKMPFSLVE